MSSPPLEASIWAESGRPSLRNITEGMPESKALTSTQTHIWMQALEVGREAWGELPALALSALICEVGQ